MDDEANAEVTQHNQPDSWISRVSAGGWQQLVPGARMLKTALAVGLSWWLAGLLGETQPMFAAMGALFGMELTIIGSLRRTGLQLVGIVGVVGIAVLLAYAMGVNAIGIGFAVLLGLWISSLAQMPDRVGVENWESPPCWWWCLGEETSALAPRGCGKRPWAGWWQS